MGKNSPAPPAVPDYVGAAREQGVANEATARLQSRLNNPNIVGPLGNQTVNWGDTFDQAGYDAALARYNTPTAGTTGTAGSTGGGQWIGGENGYFDNAGTAGTAGTAGSATTGTAPTRAQFTTLGNQPTITQTLTPAAQAALAAQQQTQAGLATLAQTGTLNAQNLLNTPFAYKGGPLRTTLGAQDAISKDPNLASYGQASGSFAGDKARTRFDYENAGKGPTAGLFGLQVGGVQGPNLQSSFGNGGQINEGPTGGQFGQAQGGVQGPNLQMALEQGGRINQGPTGGQFGYAQQGLGGLNLQGQIDTTGIAALPVSAGITGQQAIMARLQPEIDRQQRATAQQMANQGLVSGGEAYTNVMRDQSQQQNDLRLQAALQGINLDIGANQQAFNQAQARGQFANQAALSGYGADLQGGQFSNQGLQQNFSNALQAQQAQNQAQALAFQQQVQRGEFGNAAQLASFGANLQNQQTGNQAIGQNFNQAMAANQAQNATQAQRFGQLERAAQFGNQAELSGFGANLQNQQARNLAASNNFGQAQSAQQMANQAIGQNYSQNQGAAQFANQGIGQNFSQGMQTQAAQNQAIAQNQNAALQQQAAVNQAQNQGFNQNLQGAQFENTAQQQSLAQQLALRNQPLNEITGLMSGSQIQMPQFQGYSGSNIATAPIFAGAQAQNQAALQNYGIQSANVNAQNAGLYGLMGAGLGAAGAAGGFGALLAGSDRRIKQNIQYIRNHPLGVGVYAFQYKPEYRDTWGYGERVGVMAQELINVKPSAVHIHPSGYYMVDYAAI